jgi:hypothetical protein
MGEHDMHSAREVHKIEMARLAEMKGTGKELKGPRKKLDPHHERLQLAKVR